MTEPAPKRKELNFHVTMRNHSHLGQLSLADPCDNIASQLRHLGHNVSWDNESLIPPPGINLLFEGFDPDLNKQLGELVKEGYRFAVIVTERPTGLTWNDRHDSVEHNRRMICYPEAAKLMLFQLCLVPGTAAVLSKYGPAFDIELACCPQIFRDHTIRPIYDLCHFGSASPRRDELLMALDKKGYRVKAHTFEVVEGESIQANQAKRNVSIAQSRATIQLKTRRTHNLVSNSRISVSLHLKRQVISEKYDCSTPWHGIITFARNYDDLFRCVDRSLQNWEQGWALQYQRFNDTLTPENQVGAVLDAMRRVL
jgi:hypothetical protein